MAGTFSNIFNPASADAADNSEDRPFQPGAGDGTLPPDDGDGGGPPPEIAGGDGSDLAG